MRNRRRPVMMLVAVVAAVVVSMSVAASAASFVFVIVDAPGAAEATAANGINDAGQVVGVFSDLPGRFHGFLKEGARFETFDAPGATPPPPFPQVPHLTRANGINASGRIVGMFSDGLDSHGFARDGETFTVIDVPGTTENSANGINSTGAIVGNYSDGRMRGYLLNPSGFQTIDVPGSDFTQAKGINDAGQIVGLFVDATLRQRGFRFDGASFVSIDVPGSEFTVATGINNAGQVVGVSSGPPSGPASFARGFLLDAEGFTTIHVPGALYTFVNGINNAGQIVGDFFDPTTGPPRGFIAIPGVRALTVATVIPEADGVRVRFDATSAPGVRAIHFSLSGAVEAIATVDGPEASAFIAGDGETTVTYAAVDETGTTESPARLTLSVQGARRLVVTTPGAAGVRVSASPDVAASGTGGAGAAGISGSDSP